MSAAQGMGHGFTTIVHEIDPNADVRTIMASILCGATCIHSVLAAEAGSHERALWRPALSRALFDLAATGHS